MTKELFIKNLIKKIDGIYDNHQSTLPVSLIGGKTGLAIYYHTIAVYFEEEKYLEKAVSLVQEIVEELNEGLKISANAIHSFANGMAGVAFGLHYFEKHGLIDIKHDAFFSSFEDVFLKWCEKDFENETADFLHGPTGILYYLSHSKILRSSFLDAWIDLYSKHAKKDGFGWRMKNRLIEMDENEYDLCLAHGLTGHILVFDQIKKLYPFQHKVQPIIDQLLKYLFNAYKKPLEDSRTDGYFPLSIHEDKNELNEIPDENYQTRLAWCYGDLGIAYMLMSISDSDKGNLKRIGKDIALHHTKRRKPAETDVNDIFFCHGSAGVAFMYKKFYQLTGEPIFKETYEYWENYTIKYFDTMHDVTLNQKFGLNILEGLPGVVLSLLDTKQNQSNDWESIFLLNDLT